MRTLIYARFSSTLQNPRSVEDQLAACRARAEAEGWTIAGEFHDRAISGAAGLDESQRPGLHAMLERAEAGGVEQVLTESTDRLARHQGDAFTIRERLEFVGVRIVTLMDGVVDDITGTIKGLFDAKMRKDLAHRVKRGQLGNIAEGRVAGGVAYGYRRVIRLDGRGEPIRGLREIDPDRAETVLSIYRDYAVGQSPIQICARLNASGIPGPRGGIWSPSTLIGPRHQSSGILANPIYIGRLEYGRTQASVDPRTRSKRFKPSGKAPAIGEAPHLRIVSDDLWQAVQKQMESRRTIAPHRQRRPRHPFSGLAECGVCGGRIIICRRSYWGCRNYEAGRACTNNRLIHAKDFERRILDGLKQQMLAPDVVAAYLREYHREHARQAAEMTKNRTRAERRLDEVRRKLSRLAGAIAEGADEFTEIRDLMSTLRADRDRLERELAAIDAVPILTLHPGLADQYRHAIDGLEEELADESARLEAIPRLRALVARIVVTPASTKRGADIQVIRHVDRVLNLATAAA